MPDSISLFPDGLGLATEFCREASRHLDDADILNSFERYPASVAASCKASELALKAYFADRGAIGWCEISYRRV